MLIDSDRCWFILIDADWCWFILIDANLFWLNLIDADWCSKKVQPGFLFSERTSGGSSVILYFHSATVSQLTIVTLNYNIINPTLGNLCHSPNEQTMQFSCKNDNVCMHCSNAPWKNMKAPWQCMNAAILLEQKKARNRQTPRSVLLWELGPGRPSAGRA